MTQVYPGKPTPQEIIKKQAAELQRLRDEVAALNKGNRKLDYKVVKLEREIDKLTATLGNQK